MLTLCSLLAPLALTAPLVPGDLTWEDYYLPDGLERSFARSLSLDDGTLVVAGGQSGSGTYDGDAVLRAHDPATGAVLWTAADPVPGTNESWEHVEAEEGTVVAYGHLQGHGFWRARIEARDLSDSQLLWSEQNAEATWVQPHALDIHQGRVLTVHGSTDAFFPGFEAVQYLESRELATGVLQWRVPIAPGAGTGESVLELEGSGSRVFVMGRRVGASLFQLDGFVRAYDLQTGNVLWTRYFEVPSVLPLPYRMEVGDGRVHVLVPQNDPSVPVLTTLDSSNGETLWEWSSGGTGGRVNLEEFALYHGILIAAAQVGDRMVVVSLGPADGSVLWSTVYDPTPFEERVKGLVRGGDRVYVVTLSEDPEDSVAVHGFELATGDHVIGTGAVFAPLDVSIPFDEVGYADGRVLICGNRKVSDIELLDWFVQAYEVD